MYGERIKKLRQENKLTQSQLAKIISTVASTVSKYEHEKLEPNGEIIVCLCKFFGVSADYLLGLED